MRSGIISYLSTRQVRLGLFALISFLIPGCIDVASISTKKHHPLGESLPHWTVNMRRRFLQDAFTHDRDNSLGWPCAARTTSATDGKQNVTLSRDGTHLVTEIVELRGDRTA